MDRDRYARVQTLFEAALDLEGEEREQLLQRECEGDEALLGEVRELLSIDSRSPSVELETTPGRRSILELLESAPETLGKYRVVERLGHGGMGVVYKAEQLSPHRSVAIKIPGSISPSEETLRRFDLEVEALGRLQHPNIARVIEGGVEQTTRGPMPYLVMELIEGSDIRDYCKQHLRTADEIIRQFVQVCDAVHHAHQRGLIHRDLKPSNILVDRSGTPKVVDFGTVQSAMEAGDGRRPLTRTGALIGTLTYMSPEQAVGDARDLDTRADVYSLGVTLYQLLSGELPYEFAGKSLGQVLQIVKEEAPRPLSDQSRELRGDLSVIVGKAIEKDRQQRYESCSALSADLRRFLAQEPISARPASGLYHARKLARRHRPAFLGLVATLLALIGGAIATWNKAEEARAREADIKLQLGRQHARSHHEPAAAGLIWAHHLSSRGDHRSLWALRELYSRQPIRQTLLVPGGMPQAVEVDRDGERVLVLGGDGSISCWGREGEQLGGWEVAGGATAVCFGPQDSIFAATAGGRVERYAFSQDLDSAPHFTGLDKIHRLDFDSTSRHLLAFGEISEVAAARLCETDGWSLLEDFESIPGTLGSVQLGPEGQIAAVSKIEREPPEKERPYEWSVWGGKAGSLHQLEPVLVDRPASSRRAEIGSFLPDGIFHLAAEKRTSSDNYAGSVFYSGDPLGPKLISAAGGLTAARNQVLAIAQLDPDAPLTLLEWNKFGGFRWCDATRDSHTLVELSGTHQSSVVGVSDTGMAATAGPGSYVRVWDLSHPWDPNSVEASAGPHVSRHETPDDADTIHCLEYSSDGRRLVWGAVGWVGMVDVESGPPGSKPGIWKPDHAPHDEVHPVCSVVVEPTGRRMAACSYDGSVTVLQLPSLEVLSCKEVSPRLGGMKWDTARQRVLLVSDASDGKPPNAQAPDAQIPEAQVPEASPSGGIFEWDAFGDGEAVLRHQGETRWHVSDVEISERGLVVIGDRIAGLRVFRRRGQDYQRLPAPATDPVRALAMNREGSVLCSGHDDSVIRIWSIDASGLSLRGELRGHAGSVYTLDHHPTEPWLVSGDTSGEIRIWDLENEVPLAILRERDTRRSDDLFACVFDPRGERLFVAGSSEGLKCHDFRILDRFIAGNLEAQIEMCRAAGEVSAERVASLREWAGALRANQ